MLEPEKPSDPEKPSKPKEPSKPKKPSKRVWVFGAGIAGLTAAHELAERGFEVFVVEQEEDPRHYGQPALGGMARTQWAVPPGPAEDKGSSHQAQTQEQAESGAQAQQQTQEEAQTREQTQNGPPKKAAPASEFRAKRAPRLIPKRRFYFAKGKHDISRDELTRIKRHIREIRRVYGASKKRSFPRIAVKGFHRAVGESAELAEARAAAVKEIFEAHLGGVSVYTPDWQDPDDTSNRACVEVEVLDVAVAAEHGFRFFPAFYRHVFDTMSRIRLLDHRPRPSAVPFKTVLDNLVPTKTVTLALGKRRPAPKEDRGGPLSPSVDGAAPPPLQFSRERPRSFLQVKDALSGIFEGLGHTERDVAHLATKLGMYMTSGDKRRKEYEEISFADFLEIKRLSESCQKDIESAPEVLAGMRASEADARTQGSVSVQLLIQQLTGTEYSDATLNAPTTSAWIAPWRDYLREHQVTFLLGTLTDFEVANGRVLPKVTWGRRGATPPGFDPDDWFVMAVSLPALLPPDASGDELPVEEKRARGLCEKFWSVCPPGERGDFAALQGWIEKADGGWDWSVAGPKGPFRHVSGIQYYFSTNQEPTQGHTIYADSAWRLSSISQATFWSQPRTGGSGYRGVVSVDIGEWSDRSRDRTCAWFLPPDEVAGGTWKQILECLPGPHTPAQPSFYHLDDAMEFDKAKKHFRNATPYLVTRPKEWKLRPGDIEYEVSRDWLVSSGYKVAAGRWVLCGTHMKTHTRMTTMESANESARHAVNALLDAYEMPAENKDKHVPRCKIFPLEAFELGDLRWLREVDDQLFEAGIAHPLDSLRAHDWIDALLPSRSGRGGNGGGSAGA